MSDSLTQLVNDLVDQHGQMVFATAWKILGNADDAEDAMQDVFLKLLAPWKSRLKANKVMDWGAYLRVAASRSAIDILRRNKIRNEYNCDVIEIIQAPASEQPRDIAIQHEQARMLRRAISALPKQEARVFALRYFEDFTYEQIAKHLNMSVTSVGVVLHRARRRLRKTLEPQMKARGQATDSQSKSTTEGREKKHVEL